MKTEKKCKLCKIKLITQAYCCTKNVCARTVLSNWKNLENVLKETFDPFNDKVLSFGLKWVGREEMIINLLRLCVWINVGLCVYVCVRVCVCQLGIVTKFQSKPNEINSILL